MMDVRWPWWPESTYFANCNFGTNPTGIGGYGGFAGGVRRSIPTIGRIWIAAIQASFRPGSVWSFWGSNKEGEPVRVVASSEYTYPRQYIGEGASGSLGGPVWPFIRQNRWYTMMMRVWEPAGVENPQYSYIGRWVKDVEGSRWHLYGIMRLPVPATSFTGNAGFLRGLRQRRALGALHAPPVGILPQGRQVAQVGYGHIQRAAQTRRDGHLLDRQRPAGRRPRDTGHGAFRQPRVAADQIARPTAGIGKEHAFTVKQPDLPALDRPVVKDVKPSPTAGRLPCRGRSRPAASPQFAYRIGDLRQSRCNGQPLAIREERMPTVQNVLIEAAIDKPTVRLTVTDVFDQSAAPAIVTRGGGHESNRLPRRRNRAWTRLRIVVPRLVAPRELLSPRIRQMSRTATNGITGCRSPN